MEAAANFSRKFMVFQKAKCPPNRLSGHFQTKQPKNYLHSDGAKRAGKDPAAPPVKADTSAPAAAHLHATES